MWPEAPESILAEPVIIPRSQHRLSRKDIDLEALKVLYRLYHAGYKAYLVGGSVRDLLLGKPPKDFDVATDARPGEIRKLFRNSRIIGRRFRLVQVFFRGGKIVEVSTFRRRSEFDAEPEEPPSREPTYGTPGEDARRRDLTINGLFYDIGSFSLVDYVGGLADLEQGYIRVIGDPGLRFSRDPVRMLRVLRHAARTGFAIDPPAWEEIQAKGPLIRTCPVARVRDELLKDFRSGAARPFLELMLASRLFYAIFPAWESRLGEAGAFRLLELFGRVDTVHRPGHALSENLLWAVFLSPYLEQQAERPPNLREWRDFVQKSLREALAGMEIPKQRREEVSQVLALEAVLGQLFRERRPLPLRRTRLAAFPEARLLTWLKEGALTEVLANLAALASLPPPPPPRRRRPRRRRRFPKGRRPAAGGEG